jgi:hypothetical protein
VRASPCRGLWLSWVAFGAGSGSCPDASAPHPVAQPGTPAVTAPPIISTLSAGQQVGPFVLVSPLPCDWWSKRCISGKHRSGELQAGATVLKAAHVLARQLPFPLLLWVNRTCFC